MIHLGILIPQLYCAGFVSQASDLNLCVPQFPLLKLAKIVPDFFLPHRDVVRLQTRGGQRFLELLVGKVE